MELGGLTQVTSLDLSKNILSGEYISDAMRSLGVQVPCVKVMRAGSEVVHPAHLPGWRKDWLAANGVVNVAGSCVQIEQDVCLVVRYGHWCVCRDGQEGTASSSV